MHDSYNIWHGKIAFFFGKHESMNLKNIAFTGKLFTRLQVLTKLLFSNKLISNSPEKEEKVSNWNKQNKENPDPYDPNPTKYPKKFNKMQNPKNTILSQYTNPNKNIKSNKFITQKSDPPKWESDLVFRVKEIQSEQFHSLKRSSSRFIDLINHKL